MNGIGMNKTYDNIEFKEITITEPINYKLNLKQTND